MNESMEFVLTQSQRARQRVSTDGRKLVWKFDAYLYPDHDQLNPLHLESDSVDALASQVDQLIHQLTQVKEAIREGEFDRLFLPEQVMREMARREAQR